MTPEEIKTIRNDTFKVTQAEFAKMLGVTKNTVARWEVGVRNPSIPTQKFIRVLIALKQ